MHPSPPATSRASRRLPQAVPRAHPRLIVDARRDPAPYRRLLDDVRRGLTATPKSVPPKYFYDDKGSRLFDAICDLPEYYLTRTEAALLAEVADAVIAAATPDDIIEFGSGASRKTQLILDAAQRRRRPVRYIPFDVSGAMLQQSAAMLLRRYPRLRIHGVVGDYEHDLDRLPDGRQRLVLFLGSTLGNFSPAATAAFLEAMRAQLGCGDHLLLGLDLVKPVAVLEAAYNDGAGITAAFNRNVLHVLNRELGGNFVPDDFEHVAFFNRAASQIEMHLRAGRRCTVHLQRVPLVVSFDAGEMLHTEISRKFHRDEVAAFLPAAGFALQRWYTPANGYFGLALARAL